MPKIFDALNRKSGPIADPILLSLVEDFHALPVATPQPVDVQGEFGELAPEAKHSVVAPPPALAAKAAIRTLPLSIPVQSPLLPFDGENGQAAEQYRIARTKIIQHPAQPHMIVVSSAGSGDGKTLSAINLTGALALKTEANVLLVDADFRRSAVHQRLGLPPAPGLTDVLAGSSTLEEALVRTGQFPNLYVLPAGAPKSNPTELLDSSRWRTLSSVLRGAFQFVIVDSTPIWAVADYELIEAVCDGVLLVARPDYTPRKAFLQALQSIPKEKLVGVLLNSVPSWFLGKSYHYDSPYYYQTSGRQQE